MKLSPIGHILPYLTPVNIAENASVEEIFVFSPSKLVFGVTTPPGLQFVEIRPITRSPLVGEVGVIWARSFPF